MMTIKLSPKRDDTEVTYSINGTDLTINGGGPIDLSGDWVKLEPVDEDSGLEPSGYLLAGERDPDTGEITLTVRAPHLITAPKSEWFPEPITLNDGESVTFPRGVNNDA